MNGTSHKGIVLTAVVIIAVVVAGWWFFMRPTETLTVTPMTGTVSQNNLGGQDMGLGDASTPAEAVMNATVTYSKNGFEPSVVTIKKGGTVTFVDQDGTPMWVASDPHPTHQGYAGTTRSQHCPDTAGTAFDQCSTGTSYTFTFGKTGTWGYHNHAVDEDRGTVIVQ